MYFVKTPAFKVEGHSEQALRAQIESERRDLFNALKRAGIENPPVELRIEASNPKPDCIFFAYREGLLRGMYDATTFAVTYTLHQEDGLETVIKEARRAFQACTA